MAIDKKKIYQSVIATSVMIMTAFLVKQIFFNPSIENRLTKMASEMNKICPTMIDSETRLDNATALPPKTMQYNYSLINLVSDSLDVSLLRDYLAPIILNKVKTNPDMRFFRDNEVTMAFNYQDRDGHFLMKISITPDQYKN